MRRSSGAGRRGAVWAALAWGILGAVAPAHASGPRFVTGPPYFTGQDGVGIGWRQPRLLYFTDAGDLSAAVKHDAADALVAAAAGVWNVPVASITIAQGGVLAEDVSGQNTYLSSSGMVFPADVMSGNAAAVPIAVIYDADGSVTDTLLGGGASDPGGCRQNAVTESVDRFDPAGYIAHAVIVLNGRCTGTVAELQLEMQYKLERAFGRVLGLAWSQTNDNVFTGTPQPTYDQALHWPLMHPIDIICGPYSYQCLPYPFQLRADDVAGMAALYPIAQGATPAAGKQQTLLNASWAQVHVTFPTGEGMAGVNVLVRREAPERINGEGWYEASTVTGMNFRRAGTAAFVAADPSAAGSMGSWNQGWLGQTSMSYVPIPDGEPWQNLLFSTEAVNPLYMGQYSLGPYPQGTVTPSGSSPPVQPVGVDAHWGYAEPSFAPADAAQACSDGSDGTYYAAMQMPATGWWTGVLCAYRHASYAGWDVKPGRTLTVEVTALDEQGLATIHKAMPVIGLFGPQDGNDDPPTQALAATAFNARGLGTTSLTGKTGTATHLRVGIADERGDGRPDFRYQARVLYADTVTPAQLGTAGGNLTISGMGFRAGNAVAINGVTVTVTSWSATSISVQAPAMAVVHGVDGAGLDVVVSDFSTGASSTMSGALTYTSAPSGGVVLKLISAPSGMVTAGRVAATPFSVQALAADGQTPVAGQAVQMSTTAGTVTYTACGAGGCTVVTDANGLATSGVTPQGQGNVTMQAMAGTRTLSANMTVLASVGSMVLVSAPSGGQPVTTTAATAFAVKVLDGSGNGVYRRDVQFTVTAGTATFSGCFSQPCTVTTDGAGVASVMVTPTSLGTVTVLASAGGLTQQATLTGTSNQDVMRTLRTPAAQIFTGETAGVFLINLTRVDGTTADGLQPIVFTAPDGIRIVESGTTTVTRLTDGSGNIGVQLVGTKAGSYVVTAAFGRVQQSVAIVVRDHTISFQLVSAPAGPVNVGTQASTPFAVQLLQDGVTPMANVELGMGGPLDTVMSDACGGLGECNLLTDENGVGRIFVTPKKAGEIALSANYEQMVQTVTFMAVGPTETLKVVSQPGPEGVVAGDRVTLAVQAIGSDGTTVYPNKGFYYTVMSGPFALTDCGYGTCGVATDANGIGAMHGVALGTGTVTVQMESEGLTQSITFHATSRPDVVKVLSAPASGGYVGTAAALPFAVQVLFADGVTPAAGRSVTLSVTDGMAGFGACGGLAACTLQSDSNGRISTAVTPLSAGGITLAATEAGVSGTATFTAQMAAEVMQVVSAPGNGSGVGQTATAPFAVRLLSGDSSGTGLAGRQITFSVTSGSAVLGACGAGMCSVVTDSGGLASTTVTTGAAGTVALLAAEGAVSRGTSFTAVVRPDVLAVLSSPGDGAVVGSVAGAGFAVQVLDNDGVTPLAGKPVTLGVASGAGRMTACGAASCVLTTDAAGRVSSGVVPLAAGVVTLSASEGTGSAGSTVTATFRAVPQPDVLVLAGSPGASVYAGARAAGAFAVRLLLADGVTPVANSGVMFRASGMGVNFAACGAPACTLLTDSDGMASVQVEGVTPGALTLTALADSTSGAAPVVIAFEVLANDYRVGVTPAARWVAEGAALQTSVTARAVLNGSPAAGLQFGWSADGAGALAGVSSVADAGGGSTMPVTMGPLAAGALSRIRACAWSAVCGETVATGVAGSELQVSLLAGGEQATSGSGVYGPVSVQVTDGAGHAVAMAAVSVYQAVTVQAAPCPGQGRCAAAMVLATKTTVLATGEDGMVTVQPLTAGADVASGTTTAMVFSVGTRGMVTSTLTHTP